MKYSLDESVVFAEVKDQIRVIFFGTDDLYTLTGTVGKIVTKAPKSATVEEIHQMVANDVPTGSSLSIEKLQEMLDALVNIKILTIEK